MKSDEDKGNKEILNHQKKILFVYQANDGESLGIEYISAALKKEGHETGLILFREIGGFERELKKNIESFNPDFIGISVVTDNYSWACEVCKTVKKIKNIPIIFGGIQATSCPEEVIKNDFIDYLVMGEGEEAVVELVNNPKNTKIKNVWCKKEGKIIKNPLRPLVQNLDGLPFPDKEIFYKKISRARDYRCITSRGCPFSCTFCFNNYLRNLYKGQKWLRKRSVKNVIEELKIAKEKWNYKSVMFLDDCLTSDKEWFKEFITEYKKEINLPFGAISISTFINEEIAKLLKEGGCVKIQLGVQTPIEEKRKTICKRYDTNESIEMAVKELKKQGILISLDHMFSLPTESLEDYYKGLEFYIKLKPGLFNIYKLSYYPNTEIINIGKEHKIIDEEFEKNLIKGNLKFVGTVMARRGGEKESQELFRFIRWIPIFPRKFSRYLLRTGLYKKIPKNKYITKIPLIIPNFYSINLMKHFFDVRKFRAELKLKLYWSKLETAYLNWRGQQDTPVLSD